jgi:hypothetical protein
MSAPKEDSALVITAALITGVLMFVVLGVLVRFLG